MAEETAANERLLRWCGMALVVAGPLIVAAALLHPSRETAATIIASESRLVAAHVLFTLYGVLVMLGLPGLYAAHRGGMGRLGLIGFLVAMLGTYLIAVTGYFGFMAPSLGQGGACHARYHDPISTRRRFQRSGGNHLHRRLCIVRHRNDPDGDPATPVWRARRRWRSDAPAQLRHIPACLHCGMGVRRHRSREPRYRPSLGRLSAVAFAGSSPSALL